MNFSKKFFLVIFCSYLINFGLFAQDSTKVIDSIPAKEALPGDTSRVDPLKPKPPTDTLIKDTLKAGLKEKASISTIKATVKVKAKPMALVFPKSYNWNAIDEGDTLKFKLSTSHQRDSSIVFGISKGLEAGMSMDSLGNFLWVPSFETVDRLNTSRDFQVDFWAKNKVGETVARQVVFKVYHVNRPPIMDDLKPFFIQNKTPNSYKVDDKAVRDDDGDPMVFVPFSEKMPEGMKISEAGEITWQPSLTQFSELKEKPTYVEFYVEDQPYKARAKGKVLLEATQRDIPPTITVIPKIFYYSIPENKITNIKFYLSDLNGDDDIDTFNFVSDNPDVPNKALVKNTNTSYEFIWEPGYDFVKDGTDSVQFDITFYALDKSKNRDEITVHFNVTAAQNDAEKDQYYYNLYRTATVNAWALLEQMEEKEEELKTAYRKAKKGKRGRSLLSASLGASTGLAPVIARNNDNLKSGITTIGGTTVATIGTLEATEVVGKSMKDLLDRYNYVIEKKSALQNLGDTFARQYALRSARREASFIERLDQFKASMNLTGLVALELDANWESKKEPSDKNIKKRFKDFSPFEDSTL